MPGPPGSSVAAGSSTCRRCEDWHAQLVHEAANPILRLRVIDGSTDRDRQTPQPSDARWSGRRSFRRPWTSRGIQRSVPMPSGISPYSSAWCTSGLSYSAEHARSVCRTQHDRRRIAHLSDEVSKCLVVHIVHERQIATLQRRPDGSQFESNIATCVQAVMNEHVDPVQTGDESSETTAARTADIGPSISASCRDCRCRFLVKLRAERMRKVDAPEVPSAVDGHGLEDHPAGHTPRNASFEHLLRAEMTDGTPRGSAQSGVCIAVPPVGPTTKRQPLGRQDGSDVCPHPTEVLELIARPGRPQHPMECRSPLLLNVVGDLPVEQLMRDGVGNIPEGLDRI